jgi:hypothetical protein
MTSASNYYRWLSAPPAKHPQFVDSRAVAAYRVLYSLPTLLYVMGSLRVLPLIWPGHETLARLGYGAWAVVLVALLVGLWSRAAAIANVALLAVLTHHALAGCIADILMRIVGLGLVVLRPGDRWSIDALRGNRHDLQPREPISLIAWGLGVLLLCSAVPKVLSPYWRHGEGLRMTLALPWTHHPWADWIARQRWITLPANYLTIIAEASFLLLYWTRLRLIAVVNLVVLMVGFSFLMCLDYIGYTGLAAVPVLLAGQVGESAPERSKESPASRSITWRFCQVHIAYVCTFAVATLLFAAGLTLPIRVLRRIPGLAQYDKITNQVMLEPVFTEQGGGLTDMYVFRMVGEGNKELLPVFTLDGRPGPRFSGPRHLQSVMFWITDSIKNGTNHDRVFNGLVEVARQESPEPVTSVEILVKPDIGGEWSPFRKFPVTASLPASQ